jgi:transposase-like protein
VILWALRWYLAFPISYRDRASMLSDRGIPVDHTILFRRVQAYAAKLERRVRRHVEQLAMPATARHGIDVIADHQNWRNSVSGRPWRST